MSYRSRYNVKISHSHKAFETEFIDRLKQMLIIPNQKLGMLRRQLSPEDPNMVLGFLCQCPIKIRGIIIGLAPYPCDALEIPFMDPEFTKLSNIKIANRIADYSGIPFDAVSGCDLSAIKHLFIMNGAFTVIKPKKGERFTGVHVDLWSNIFKAVLEYVIVKSNPDWIIMFGRDSNIEENIRHTLDSLGNSYCSLFSSYHPVSPAFLGPHSTVFEQVNSMLLLRQKKLVSWWHALSLSERRRARHPELNLDEASLYQKLLTLRFKIKMEDPIILNSVSTLLDGDSSFCKSQDIAEVLAIQEDISRTYHADLKLNLEDTKKFLETKSFVDINLKSKIYSDSVCYSGYYLDREALWLWVVNNEYKTIGFRVDFLYPMFMREIQRPDYGWFDEVTEANMPLTPYEGIVDIINSKIYKYIHSEIGWYLLRRRHTFELSITYHKEPMKDSTYIKSFIKNLYIKVNITDKDSIEFDDSCVSVTQSGLPFYTNPCSVNFSVTDAFPLRITLHDNLYLRSFETQGTYTHVKQAISRRMAICMLVTCDYELAIGLWESKRTLREILEITKDFQYNETIKKFEFAVAYVAMFSAEYIDRILSDMRYINGKFVSENLLKLDPADDIVKASRRVLKILNDEYDCKLD